MYRDLYEDHLLVILDLTCGDLERLPQCHMAIGYISETGNDQHMVTIGHVKEPIQRLSMEIELTCGDHERSDQGKQV